jgi:hypothetical protein
MGKFIVSYIPSSNASTETQSNEPGKRKPKVVCRQYSDNDLSFGFFWYGDATCPIRKCLFVENLVNNDIFPSKLKW